MPFVKQYLTTQAYPNNICITLAPTASDNWGSVQLPRVGQEVLVDFIEGDIDRPIVIASVYNGQGQANAQYNQINNTLPA